MSNNINAGVSEKYLTESEVRVIIGNAVEKDKAYNTKSLKDWFLGHAGNGINTSEGDWRNIDGAFRILKVIGNVVSHQKESVKSYDEGFTLIKSVRPALFVSNDVYCGSRA